MDVADIQRALAARGFDPGAPDGDAGPRSVATLAAFQRARGLVADGIAGPATAAALGGGRAVAGEPPWLVLARAALGTIEGIGRANNPIVLAYFADAGFPGIRDDAVAWCAAFVGAMLRRVGLAPSGSLAARSYEAWGRPLDAPALGAVGVKRRGGGWQGHVGFVVGAAPDHVVLLGGNQGDAVNVAAFRRSEFTAFRWPAEVPPPADLPLPTTVAGARSGTDAA